MREKWPPKETKTVEYCRTRRSSSVAFLERCSRFRWTELGISTTTVSPRSRRDAACSSPAATVAKANLGLPAETPDLKR